MSEPTNDPNCSYVPMWATRRRKPTTAVGHVHRLRLVPLVLVLGLLAAACSSDSSKPPTTADWANGVCSAVNTWTGSLKSAADSLKNTGLSTDSLQSAADDARSATDKLGSDLEKLGKPNTPAGQQAKDAIDQLSSQLKADTDSIKSTVDSVSGVGGVATAAATISATVVTMGNQVTSTVTSLEDLDASAKGELQTAFEQSTACQKLSSSSPSST